MRALLLLLSLAVGLVAAPAGAIASTGSSSSSAQLAAAQITLQARGLYAGPVTGEADAATTAAVRALQIRFGVPADGVLGPETLARLAPRRTSALGARPLSEGDSGFDVGLLQIELAWHGFPSGPLTGTFTPRTTAAVVRFQRWAGLPTTGIAGPLTARALSEPAPTVPVRLSWPINGALTSGFGLRGTRFHAGIDIEGVTGQPVAAPGAGRVVYAGWREGGFGYEVTIAHGRGVRTIVAHLSRVDVTVGQVVAAGQQVGLVGATGDASGPHVHFEVRARGAVVDPLGALAS